MLRNYFLVAWRNLLRHKSYSFILISGLAAGLTSVLLILLFVVEELSYDTHHSQKDRIYRITYSISDFQIARVPPIFKEHLNDFFPEVEKSSRMFSRGISVQVGENNQLRKFEEPNVNFVDDEIFEIFDFEVVDGQLAGALDRPFTAVLNRELAEKYFPGQTAVGQTITLEGNRTFTVTAVVEDFPPRSHVHFDMLLPYDQMYDVEPPQLAEGIRQNFQYNWMVSHSPTYVLLREGTTPENVNQRFVGWVDEKIPASQRKGQSFEIQPLLDIHLDDEIGAQAEPPGSFTFIWIAIGVGFLTLLIAVINFVNLSTSRSLYRAKEIGMRKVCGASKSSLIRQFLGESLITTFFAGLVSLGLAVLLIPQLNLLTLKELSVEQLITVEVMGGFFVLILLTSLLAGTYPAFYITRFSSLASLKGRVSSGPQSETLRKGLLVVQFTISIILISGTLIVFDQLHLLRTQPLGFQKEFMINVPLQSASFNSVFGGVDEQKYSRLQTFEDKIGNLSGVRGSTLSSGVPGFGMVNRNIIPEGFTAEDNMLSPVMGVDYDFLDVYEIKLLAGRGLDRSYGSDDSSAFVINETAARTFLFGEPEEALGKSINMEGKKGKVVGVVEDFNFLSLAEAMRPLIMEINIPQFSVFTIKLAPTNVEENLASIEREWNSLFPDETFNATFLDQSLADNYNSQERFGKMIAYFAILAIIISSLGSYGLIMFIAIQKQKEVGVRKVLGASILNIILILAKKFTTPIFIAILLAVPATILVANRWLEDFSYHVDISILNLTIGAFITIFLILLTISYQAWKAARINPSVTLRNE